MAASEIDTRREGQEERNDQDNISKLLKNVVNLEELHFNVIDKYFKENSFVEHHIRSVNHFYEHDIKQVLGDMNPISFNPDVDEKSDTHSHNIDIYFGGKKMDKVYYGKPVLYENDQTKILYPNEARLRNITYAISIHVDIEVYFESYEIKNGKIDKESVSKYKYEIPKYYLGAFPVMTQTKLCSLGGLPTSVKYDLGECKHDYGGYFIIDGKEKVLVPQEAFSNNLIYVRPVNDNMHDFSVEIRSISRDESKPKRTMAIRRIMKKSNSHNENIVVFIPNVRKPVPLFILMRALGLKNDKEIIETIIGNIDENEHYLDLLRPSVIDNGGIYDTLGSLEYIASITKEQSLDTAYYILSDFLLPHLGELNFEEKAHYIGYMVKELLKVIAGERKPTDRDSYKYKRVETSGNMMKQLFSEYANIMYKQFYLSIEKEYYYSKEIYRDSKINTAIDQEQTNDSNQETRQIKNKGSSEVEVMDYVSSSENFRNLIIKNHERFFQQKIIYQGFKKAFKGDWGAYSHTKKIGVIQPLNRLSYNSFLSHLRKINLNIDASAKIVAPHMLHGSQWGLIDPVDTPDGGNVGFHKHMAMMCKVSNDIDETKMKKWIMTNMNGEFQAKNTDGVMKLETIPLGLSNRRQRFKYTKVFINGDYCCITNLPFMFKKMFLNARRMNFIPKYCSLSFNIQDNHIFISCDEGRLLRPLFYFDKKTINYFSQPEVLKDLIDNNFTWRNCIFGFKDSDSSDYRLNDNFKDIDISIINNKENYKSRSILEYIDKNEEDSAYICMYANQIKPSAQYNYSHCEIHPSMIFGVMGNQVILPEHNQLPRNLFSCGQSKQAVSLYHSNFPYRIDKMGVMLNYGENPLVKNRIFKYIHEEEHPYGFNAIVAIMCYNAYNVEDSILINEGSLGRGIYHTTYYNMYEVYEEDGELNNGSYSIIKNLKDEPTINVKPGYDYNYLNEHGIIKENTEMDDKKVLIGKVSFNDINVEDRSDASVMPKKGQLGYVDKTYITQENEGRRIAKVRIREQRIPAMGDKFCSRCGQKGTIGTIIPEADMPFTKDGIRPDIIINPHAIPSRMTIGQLVETIMSKVGVNVGTFMDATPFTTDKDKIEKLGNILNDFGMHSSGNEYLYNGMTGEQIEYSMFMGPTYYMRLKHMVKDKINYRSTGPRTLLTRQTNHGRANDGGLRIGEMERDGMIAHGCSFFIKDSMMTRGDKYRVAICNHTGTIAIYDKKTQNFYSPLIDGPIEANIEGKDIVSTTKISKHGRMFSVVEIPYSLKLLMHELSAMNVQMRLITSDNIDNLDQRTSTIKFSNILNKMKRGKNQSGDDGEQAEDEIVPIEIKNEEQDNKVELKEEERIKLPRDIHLWMRVTDDEQIVHYVSLLVDENGDFESYTQDEMPNRQPPDFYPKMWDFDLIRKHKLSSKVIANTLAKYGQFSDNFNVITSKMIELQRNAESIPDVLTLPEYSNLEEAHREINDESQGNNTQPPNNTQEPPQNEEIQEVDLQAIESLDEAIPNEPTNNIQQQTTPQESSGNANAENGNKSTEQESSSNESNDDVNNGAPILVVKKQE